MNNNLLNEFDLEAVSGGTAENAAFSAKYKRDDFIRFFNPNNPSETLTGVVHSVLPAPGEDGLAIYTVMVSDSPAEAAHLAGRPYRVGEGLIIGLAG